MTAPLEGEASRQADDISKRETRKKDPERASALGAFFYSARWRLSGLVFLLTKVQAVYDGRFRPAGQAPKVSDDRVDFFLPQPPAPCFFP